MTHTVKFKYKERSANINTPFVNQVELEYGTYAHSGY